MDQEGTPGVALFDLDNTLIDRNRGFRRWAVGFLAERGLDAADLDWVVRTDGDGQATRHEFFAAVRARYGLVDTEDDLVAGYHDVVASLYSPELPVLRGLQALRAAGWRTAVVTNGPESQFDKMCAAGLDTVIDGWCISGVEGVAKPERRIFEEAARRCGSPLQGWMVGDTPEIDILGGINAGLRTIWVARGRNWSISEYTPDLVAGDATEASRMILERAER